MSLADLRQELSEYRIINAVRKSEIQEYESKREKYEYYISLKNTVQTYIEELSITIKYLKDFLIQYEKESNNFKQARLQYIDDELTVVLSRVFPVEGYTAKLEINQDKQEPTVCVKLYNKDKTERDPRVNDGGCVSNLTTISIPASILTVNNNMVYIIDELLANASSASKLDFSATLEVLVQRGMQLIIISQSREVYEDLARREFMVYPTAGRNLSTIKCSDKIGVNK